MRKVKVKVIFAAVLLVSLGLLSACQPTPEQVVVVAKGDGMLEEKIAAGGETSLPSDMPEEGTRITTTIKHPNLAITIDVDAVVDTQDGKTMPSVKVAPHKFTQQEVDNVYEKIVGDAHFFQVPEDEVWEFGMEQRIASVKKRLATAREDGDDELADRLEEQLENALQDSIEAKDAAEFSGHFS
jgi:hypothetical protein